jgi:EmrB/QacA subfamily drug resistance transporter
MSTRRAWAGVAAAALSIFLFVADSGLMAIALPAIEREYSNVQRATVAWVATSFVVAQSAMLLIAGQIGDRRGRKRFYLFGLGVFSIGALIVGTSQQLGVLIGGRVVQGVGAAFLTSGALPMVLPLFPEVKRHLVVGVWGAIGSVAAWATPIVGGLLVESSWRWAFLALFPVSVLGLAIAARVLDEASPSHDGQVRLDRVSAMLGPPGFGLGMLVLAQGRRWGWGHPLTLWLGALAVLFLTAFVVRCQRVEGPLLDFRIFRTGEYSANVAVGAFQQIGFFSWYLTGPLIMTQLWGWSPTQAGMALAASQLLSTVGSPIAGWSAERIGPHPVTAIGALINTVGSLWLIVTSGPEPHVWSGYLPAAMMLGFGASFCGTVSSGASLAALPARDLGVGNSIQQLIRRAFGSIGVALAVALLGESTGDAILGGARRVWWLGAVAHLLILVPVGLSYWKRTQDTNGFR